MRSTSAPLRLNGVARDVLASRAIAAQNLTLSSRQATPGRPVRESALNTTALLAADPEHAYVTSVIGVLQPPVEFGQFRSWAFTHRAIDSGLLPSMARWVFATTAMIESFWSRMQVELFDRKRWQTRVELANAIFEYIEIFYNRRRRYSSLGVLTPFEFETRHLTMTVA